MDTRTTLTDKGSHNGWTIYKHDGVPGLALPHATYWVVVKGDVRLPADTKLEAVRRADLHDAITPEARAHADRVAAMLTNR